VDHVGAAGIRCIVPFNVDDQHASTQSTEANTAKNVMFGVGGDPRGALSQRQRRDRRIRDSQQIRRTIAMRHFVGNAALLIVVPTFSSGATLRRYLIAI